MVSKIMPFSDFEKRVFKKGYHKLAGIDEVGRGALIGPVTAAIVAVSKGLPRSLTRIKIKDSKQLSPKQREEVFNIVKQEPMIEWRVSAVWPTTIDRINIWQATLLAWQRCLKKLNPQPDFLFLDGKQGMPRLKIEQQSVIKGDQKIFLLSLASIMAKVSRDKLMERLEKKYPGYQLARHKGYGTRLHFERLKKIGPCPIHRRSFQPVFSNLSFKEKIDYVVSQIPRGRVMTYQQVAQRIGHPRAYRAVGNVLNKNVNPQVPCHRVIRANGQIGGYRGGSQLKRKILIKEGFLS